VSQQNRFIEETEVDEEFFVQQQERDTMKGRRTADQSLS
jgi:hypothetical protein